MFSKLFTTVKYMLVTINFIFLITGIIVISVGGSVQSAYNGYHPFLADRFFSLPAFCIATGIIIFLIAFAGFYGAYTENPSVIQVYAGAMILMFIFQLSACIAGYALKGNTIALVEQKLKGTMDLYGLGPTKSFEITKLWDEIQLDFECCGVTRPDEWLVPLETVDDKLLPLSCCNHTWGVVHVISCTTENVQFKSGCAEAFGDWVKGHAGTIGGAGVFLVLAQALAVAGALWMAKVSRDDTYIP